MSDVKSVTVDAMSGIEGARLCISQFTDNFNTVRFCINSELTGYTLMIVAEIEGEPTVLETDGTHLYTEYDKKTAQNYLVWHLGREVTCADGLVVYQIVAYKTENGEVVSTWYSREGRIIVADSVDTTSYSTALIGSHPNLITRLILKTDEVSTLANELKESKLDKLEGKGLSENDFTDFHMEKLDGIENGAEVNTIEKIKVDGKEVEVSNYDKSVNLELQERFDAKLDKEDGKMLSTNDFTDGFAAKLETVEQFAQENKIEKVMVDGSEVGINSREKSVNIDLSGKVDKVDGMGLSSNDYTNSDKEKVSGIINFVRKDFPDSFDTTSRVFADSLTGEGYGTTVYYGNKGGWNNYMLAVVRTGEDTLRYIQYGFPNSDGRISDTSTCALMYRYGVYESYEDSETGNKTWFINWSAWTEFLTEFNVKKVLYPEPFTAIPYVLRTNTSYNFGTVTKAFDIRFPNIANDGDVIYVTFETGDTAIDLSVDTSNTSDVDIDIEANTGYEIYSKYNGKIWIVNYSEYTVTNG